MALTKNCCKFLFYAKTLGVSFDKALTLGRLHLYATKKDIGSEIKFFKNNSKNIDEVVFKDEYSEPLFQILGGAVPESLDFSDYEKATIIHDLNQTVPPALKEKYSVIVDGGTIEHVFNFPVAIKNCMEMLRIGGHYIGITPVNNNMGHGFYQFSPELFYTIFTEVNGFRVEKMIVYTQGPHDTYSDWYEVADPAKVKNRIMLVNSKPTFMIVLAKKMASVPVFAVTPQQSDYQNLWAIQEALNENKIPANESRLKYFYRKFTPLPVKILLHKVYDLFAKRKIRDKDLGEMNAEHFRKVVLKAVE